MKDKKIEMIFLLLLAAMDVMSSLLIASLLMTGVSE